MLKGLTVGHTFPDIRLPDENGRLHTLSELQGSDVLVLCLGRGEHCPRERQHQRELLRFHEWASVAFTQLVTVLPNDLHDVSKLKLSTGARWTFLADAELELQTALDIREYTDEHHAATVPHTVILSPGLRIEKVYVGYWFWGRPSPYQLWEDIQALLPGFTPDYDPTTAQARAVWQRRQPSGRRPAPAHA